MGWGSVMSDRKLTDCCNAPLLTDGSADWCSRCKGVSRYVMGGYECTQADPSKRAFVNCDGNIVFRRLV